MNDMILNHTNFHMEAFAVDYDNPTEVNKFLKRFNLKANNIDELQQIQNDVFVFLCWYTKNKTAGVEQLIKHLLKDINSFVREEVYLDDDEIKTRYKIDNMRTYCLSLIKDNMIYKHHIKECKECENYFVAEHEHQIFCTKLPTNKRSTCENTFNKRLRRQRKRENIEYNSKVGSCSQ